MTRRELQVGNSEIFPCDREKHLGMSATFEFTDEEFTL